LRQHNLPIAPGDLLFFERAIGMSGIDLERLAAEAMQRISYFINRMAAQHQRRMR
jgi:hypothetical protein